VVQADLVQVASKQINYEGMLIIVEHMFSIVGVPFVQEEIEWDEEWYLRQTFTKEQHKSFESWLIDHIRTKYKQPKYRAKSAASWILLMHGFPIKEDIVNEYI